MYKFFFKIGHHKFSNVYSGFTIKTKNLVNSLFSKLSLLIAEFLHLRSIQGNENISHFIKIHLLKYKPQIKYYKKSVLIP